MDLQLARKRALVTGSSSGIGIGIAKALVDEGASVVVHGRNAERLAKVEADLKAAGATVASAIGDLSTDEGADAVIAATNEAFGGVDILVNNAGGASEEGEASWFKVELDEWVQSYQKNVVAAGRLVHAFVPGMKEAGWGRVIQVSSAAGIIPTSAQPEYGPAKAAMINMSMGLSKALAGSGITVNTISPGMIRTAGLEDFLRKFADKRGWGDDLDKAADYIIKGTGQSVHRMGEVEDMGYAVVFLASPHAGFLNGINIHLDGGGTQSIY